MSSHVTKKTTRNTTQDASHILSGTDPEMTSKQAFHLVTLTHDSGNVVNPHSCELLSLHRPDD